jgi:phage tail sheath gpL-like
MTTPPVQIIGFATNDFVPGFIGETVLGAGSGSTSSIPIRVLLVGNKTVAGTATANQDVTQIFDDSNAATLYGARSELRRMCRAALRIPGVTLYAAPTPQSAGTAATMTITFQTNASSAGSFVYYFASERVEVPVANSDAPTAVGDALVAAMAAVGHLPCTAVNAAGTVTVTWAQTGLRGNQAIVHQDLRGAPTGMTSTLGGGTAATGGGRFFGGGTTSDDVTTIASVTFPEWYPYVALAANDATNLAVWESTTDAKAGPLEGRPEFVVVSSNGTLSATQSLTQTTLNNPYFQMLWQLQSESPPAELSALFAALRSVTEDGNPIANYNGKILAGVLPARFPALIPQRATQVAALQTGITPITTVSGEAKVVRSITTKCLNGTAPDYRTLDTGQAVVPNRIRLALAVRWASYAGLNPVAADDPGPDLPERRSGVATPRGWNAEMTNELRAWESGAAVSSGIPQIIDVDLNLPSSGWDKNAKRIMSRCPVVPAYNNAQVGVSVQQL